MKKKVNINRPEISSEEILKRKNFDSVLKQHTVVSKPFYKNPWFLSGGGIALVAAVTAIVLKVNNPDVVQPKTSALEIAADTAALASFYKAEEAKPCIAPPINGLDIPYTVYKVTAEKGATLDFKTGSKITVPKNCFVDASGKLVKGEVDLHYREFHDAFDFFIAGIPMTYDSAGTRYQFESAGMMEIMGYKNGQPLAVAPDKSINVELASNYEGKEYNLYKLDTGANNWACLGKDKVVKNEQKKNVATTENVSNIQSSTEYKVLETQKKEVQKEKEAKIASFYTALPEPKKPEQSKKDKYTFDLDVDPKEYPELAVYKGVLFEVGSENKGFNSSMYSTVWDEAVVKDGPQKGTNYMLTLKKASRTYDLVVYPVFEGKNYEVAMKEYQDKLAKYNTALDKRKADEKRLEDEYQAKLAALKKQQEELERKWKEKQDSQFRQMSTDEKVHRVFAINGFGVYNSDNPAAYPKGVSCTAKLNNAEDERLMCYHVYLVDKEKNALFTYAKNPVVEFSFNPNSKNLLWTVENGTLYWLKPEQFASIKNGGNINSLRLTKVEQQFKNADEMKAFFNF